MNPQMVFLMQKLKLPVIKKPKPASPPTIRKVSTSESHHTPRNKERHVPMTCLRNRLATLLKDSQNSFALLTLPRLTILLLNISCKRQLLQKYLHRLLLVILKRS